MPRKGIKPFYRRFTKSYYVQIDGKQINLGRDKKAAGEKCKKLLASRRAFNAATTTVKGLLAMYLEWCLRHRSKATYYAAQFYTKSFAATLPEKLKVDEIQPKHVIDWICGATTWSSTSKHDAITYIQRVFSWAVNERILEYHPLYRIEGKPSRKRREVYYSPSQWGKLLSHIRDQNFRDLLIFMSETGCRPIEARTLEARHCNLEHRIIVFPTEESKGQEFQRTIVLTDPVHKICERLCHSVINDSIAWLSSFPRRGASSWQKVTIMKFTWPLVSHHPRGVRKRSGSSRS